MSSFEAVAPIPIPFDVLEASPFPGVVDKKELEAPAVPYVVVDTPPDNPESIEGVVVDLAAF